MKLTHPSVSALLLVSLAIGCDACRSSTAPDIIRYPLTVNPASLDIAAGGRFQFTAQGGDSVGEAYTWSLPDGGGELESGQYQWQKTLRAGLEGGRYRLLLSTSGGRSAQASFQVHDQFSLELLSADPPSGSELVQGTGYVTFRFRYVAPGSGLRSIWVSFRGGSSEQAGGDGHGLGLDATGIGEATSTFTAVFSCQPCVVETTAVRAGIGSNSGAAPFTADFPLRYIWK